MTKTIRNFGRTVKFRPADYFRPDTPVELLRILGDHPGQKFRAIGSLHSWSRAPETDGIVIDTSGLNSIQIIETVAGAPLEHPRVKVGGGCKVKDLLKQLASSGLTLPSIGLIDEQTVAGATATGTHGSGKNSLSHYIVEAEIAHFDPETGKPKITVVNKGNELLAARCSLGLAGIVVSLTFLCRKRYNVVEHAESHPTIGSALAEERDFPIQQFYLMPWSWTCFAHHRRETDASRSHLAGLYRAYCFLFVDVGLHLLVYFLAKIYRARWMTRLVFKRILPLTIIRNWRIVDDSHSALVMEHELFRHCEVEVFVRRPDLESAAELLMDVIRNFGGQKMENNSRSKQLLAEAGMLEAIEQSHGTYCHHYPICFRRILSDDTLISMASPGKGDDGEDWYSISFITYEGPKDREGFFTFAKQISTLVARLYGGRCHWGKVNPLDRDTTESLYPRLSEFKEVVNRFDPSGRFSNEWFDSILK